ncbi:MAG: 4Fe-4S binding protein [bacterium]
MNDRSTWDRWAGAALVFGFGAFPLFAQALLFRSYLTVFEGHEFAVGCFFGSWLLWLCAGALVGTRLTWLDRVGARIALLPLLYVPAFAIQYILISGARDIAGIPSYEFFPLAQVVPVSLLANAPVSFLTGLLFTRACSWIAQERRLPLAYVYAVESLGSFAGGLAGTATLAAGCSVVRGLAGATVLLLIAAAVDLGRTGKRAMAAATVAAALVLGVGMVRGVDERVADRVRAGLWQRLLPGGSYAGHFATPQGEYLFGSYGEQFNVIAGRSIAETVPELERASEIVALHLAQKPDARRVLVIGPGAYAVCARFLDLPQIEHVTWLHTDPAYPPFMLAALPGRLRIDNRRFDAPAIDARDALAGEGATYDLVVVKLPDATTLVLNRYFTGDFFAALKRRLAPDGLVGVRVSGGENFLGGDLAYLGASAWLGLQEHFAHVGLKPGDDTWLLASDTLDIADDPDTLIRRFEGAPGSNRIYPAEGLRTLYPRDRIAFQSAVYRRTVAVTPRELLVTTDEKPRAMLNGLLLAAKQAGGGEGQRRAIQAFALVGLRVTAIALGFFVVLRAIFVRKHVRDGGGRVFDGAYLVFSTGFVGMASAVLLMFLFQARFGSLAVQAGLLSALFMLGLYAGSVSSRFALDRRPDRAGRWLAAAMALHVALLAALAAHRGPLSAPAFHALFLACGACTGAYVPVAAIRLRRRFDDASSGAAFVAFDNLGGAAGGVVAALVLVPALGTVATLAVLAFTVLSNVVSFVRCRPPIPEQAQKGQPPGCPRACGSVPLQDRGGVPFHVVSAEPVQQEDLFDRWRHPAGYALAGLALAWLAGSMLLHNTPVFKSGAPLLRAARAMIGTNTLRLVAMPESRPEQPDYYAVVDPDGAARGYVLSSARFGGGARGYGGRLVLAVMTEPDGKVLDLRVIESRETPSYLARVVPWMKTLRGRNAFDDEWVGRVDGVSGATFTSEAVLRSLQQSGRGFAAVALKRGPGPEQVAAGPGLRVERGAVAVLVLVLVALVAHVRPSRGLRRIILLTALVVAGLHLNAQYAMDQVLALVSFAWPEPGLTLPFMMVVVVPLVVFLFGNVYCGYVCPFGALQELAGDLWPRAWRVDPCKPAWRYARAVKFAILFAMLVWFGAGLQREVAGADPLVSVFTADRLLSPGWWVGGLLVLSLVSRRFWCRNLCPAGAFLSVVGAVRPLARRWPPVQPQFCDL